MTYYSIFVVDHGENRHLFVDMFHLATHRGGELDNPITRKGIETIASGLAAYAGGDPYLPVYLEVPAEYDGDIYDWLRATVNPEEGVTEESNS